MSLKLSKQEIVKEIVKSGKDPVYFINNYARISHPMRGLIPFKTYDFQTDLISYSIATGVDRSFNIQQATYTDTTIELLLQDIERRLNHSCDFKATDSSKKMMGIGFNPFFCKN